MNSNLNINLCTTPTREQDEIGVVLGEGREQGKHITNTIEDIKIPGIGSDDFNWDTHVKGTEVIQYEDIKNNNVIMEVVQQENRSEVNKGMNITEGSTPMDTSILNIQPTENNQQPSKYDDGPNTVDFQHALHLASKYYTQSNLMPFQVWAEAVKKLIDLNKRYSKPFIPSSEQYRAILTTARRVLIDACPGSGKTTTLMHKIFFDGQILDKNAKQLALTYTRAASYNMTESYNHLCKRFRMGNTVEFGTIHAFARRIETWKAMYDVLPPDGMDKVVRTSYDDLDDDSTGWNLFGDEDELSDNEEIIRLDNVQIITQAVESLGYTRNYQEHLTSIEGWINVVIERMITTQEELLRLEEFNELEFVHIDELLNIMKVARGIRQSYDVMDFTDMLVYFYNRLKSYETLEDVEDIYIKGQLTLTHIYVDEFQDISPLQWEIVSELLRLNPDAYLYCVGDADQAIYSFRGADSKYLVKYKDIVTGGCITENDVDLIFFTINRRSGKSIVNLTSEFIQTNKFRYNKQMNSYENKESNIRIIPDLTKDYKNSREMILREILELKRQDPARIDYSNIGILYREHQQSFLLMIDLVEKGLPINIGSRYHPAFFSEVSDILGIWSMLLNSKNVSLLENYLFKCMEGLNKEKSLFIANKVKQTGGRFTDFLGGTDTLKQDVIDLRSIYRDLNNNNLESALKKTCYKYYKAYLAKFFSRQWKLDVANYYLSKWTDLPYLDLLEKHNYTKDYIDRFNSNIYGIAFKTIHSSKGLEYDNVYVMPVGDSTMPKETILSKMSPSHQESYIEEERRLLYVALSRARTNLTMFVEKLTDTFPMEVYSISTRQSLR